MGEKAAYWGELWSAYDKVGVTYLCQAQPGTAWAPTPGVKEGQGIGGVRGRAGSTAAHMM